MALVGLGSRRANCQNSFCATANTVRRLNRSFAVTFVLVTVVCGVHSLALVLALNTGFGNVYLSLAVAAVVCWIAFPGLREDAAIKPDCGGMPQVFVCARADREGTAHLADIVRFLADERKVDARVTFTVIAAGKAVAVCASSAVIERLSVHPAVLSVTADEPTDVLP